MSLAGIKIFAADEIKQAGLTILEQKGFFVLTAYGLSNNALLKYVSRYKSAGNQKNNSALIIRSTRKFSKEDIRALKLKTDIRLLCTASSGYDNIDINSANENGVRVLNVPGGNSISAAEHTMVLLLAAVKNIIPSNNEMKRGMFDFTKYSNTELYGKTIGIIGVGRVGSHVAKLARTFGMKVIGNDIKKSLAPKYKWIKFSSVNNLILNSDIITVHTPLDSSTEDLLNAENLKKAKKNVIVLNCARGGIINEKDLIKLLNSGRIKYAGIDVFEKEPDFNRGFSRLSNVILTPHLAGKTIESRERISKELALRIIDYYNGKRNYLR